ncbi:MAG: O-antigen ligase family protein [Minisyncoccia bacterium]
MKNTKKILEYLIISGLFLLPFIPFIVPSNFFFPFITGKGFAFRILVEILFGLFVILCFVDKEYRPNFSWITKSVLLFTFVTFVADIFGENPYKSMWSNFERMEGFVLIAHLCLFYLVISSFIKQKKKWHQYINLTIGASVLMSVYSLFQLAGKLNINQGGVRVDATFGNATYMAIYVVFHIFLSLYMLTEKESKKWQKWTYGGIILLETTILYFTATRGAILGLIGGVLLTGLILLFKDRGNAHLRKISYSILGLVVAIVLIFISVKDTGYVKTSPVLSRFSSLSFSEIKTQGRYFVWPMAVKGVIERPILGWGQENFNFVFNKNYDPRMWNQEQWFDRTHNVFLDWLIAGGLLGFLSYASMYLALFYYIWRKKTDLTVLERSVLTGMISAYIFHNIFVFDNLISYIMFFTVLGYIHAISTHDEPRYHKFHSLNFSHDTVNYVVFPTVLVATIGMIYFVNIPAISANINLIKALTPSGNYEKNLELFKKAYSYNSLADSEITEQIVTSAIQAIGTQGVDNKIKNDFYNLAKTQIEKKINKVPNDARYLVFAGSFFNRVGQFDEAIKYLDMAVKESPRKQSILFELGSSYIGKGDLPKMFEMFKKAYELEPSSNEALALYAVGAIYTKNIAVLKELQSKISTEDLIKDDRFLRAYSEIGDYQTVLTILNARLEKDPKNPQNNLLLASTYASLGQKQKAIEIIQKIINENPSFKAQGEGYIKEIESR